MNPLFFLTSDDGYYSKGYRTLLNFFKEKNIDYFSIVPSDNKSGISHAISLNKTLDLKEKEKNVYLIKGTPVDAILLTLFGNLIFKKPDIIISGINRGFNLGVDILYSGTVAAVKEGFIYGIPGIALSIGNNSGIIHWETAEFFLEKLVDYISKNYNKLGKFLWNINIPDVARDKIKGIEWTKLGKIHYLNPVEIIERNKKFKLGGKMNLVPETGTDVSAVLSNKISITPLNLFGTEEEEIERRKQVSFL